MAALSMAQQYEKTRSALLTVAHELFAKKGYAATSTQDIVERAGVARGALYYHFHNAGVLVPCHDHPNSGRNSES